MVWLRGVPGGKLSQIFVTDEGTVRSKISQLQVESRARLHACFVFSAFPELQKKLTKKGIAPSKRYCNASLTMHLHRSRVGIRLLCIDLNPRVVNAMSTLLAISLPKFQ